MAGRFASACGVSWVRQGACVDGVRDRAGVEVRKSVKGVHRTFFGGRTDSGRLDPRGSCPEPLTALQLGHGVAAPRRPACFRRGGESGLPQRRGLAASGRLGLADGTPAASHTRFLPADVHAAVGPPSKSATRRGRPPPARLRRAPDRRLRPPPPPPPSAFRHAAAAEADKGHPDRDSRRLPTVIRAGGGPEPL